VALSFAPMWTRLDTGDHRVNDGLSEAIGQREVGLQEPVIRRSEEQVEHDVRVDISRSLPSRERPIDHEAMLCPDTGDEALSPNLGQIWIPLDFGNQPDQRATRHRSLDRPDPAAQGSEEVAAQGSGVRGRLVSKEASREGFEDQHAFRRPPPVDGGFAYPTPLCHLIHGQVDEAALFQDLVCGFEDGAMGAFAAGPPSWSGYRNRGFFHG
jgi:hypothetical protein